MKLYSVREFCELSGISRGLFYALLRDGKGPHVMKLNRRTLISEQAASEWRLRMETEGDGSSKEAA